MKNTRLFITLGALSIVMAGASTFAYQGGGKMNSTDENRSYQQTKQYRGLSTAGKRTQENQKGKIKGRNNKKQRFQGSQLANLSSKQVQMTDEIKNGLLLMREEEKVARDVYLTLAEKYNTRVFTNIAKAEQQHMDAIKTLIDVYGIQDPVVSDQVGIFSNEKLQSLYNDLLAKGEKSLSDGIQVVITIEELDINDLEELLVGMEDGTDIKQVYTNLLDGSQKHLSAFQRQL